MGYLFIKKIFLLPSSILTLSYFKCCIRLKGNKKEEQYRLLWAELETLLIASSKSPGHKAILQCIRECRSRGPETADKIELDHAIREIESTGKFQ